MERWQPLSHCALTSDAQANVRRMVEVSAYLVYAFEGFSQEILPKVVCCKERAGETFPPMLPRRQNRHWKHLGVHWLISCDTLAALRRDIHAPP